MAGSGGEGRAPEGGGVWWSLTDPAAARGQDRGPPAGAGGGRGDSPGAIGVAAAATTVAVALTPSVAGSPTTKTPSPARAAAAASRRRYVWRVASPAEMRWGERKHASGWSAGGGTAVAPSVDARGDSMDPCRMEREEEGGGRGEVSLRTLGGEFAYLDAPSAEDRRPSQTAKRTKMLITAGWMRVALTASEGQQEQRLRDICITKGGISKASLLRPFTPFRRSRLPQPPAQ